jgi:hypothetical protein
MADKDLCEKYEAYVTLTKKIMTLHAIKYMEICHILLLDYWIDTQGKVTDVGQKLVLICSKFICAIYDYKMAKKTTPPEILFKEIFHAIYNSVDKDKLKTKQILIAVSHINRDLFTPMYIYQLMNGFQL